MGLALVNFIANQFQFDSLFSFCLKFILELNDFAVKRLGF